MNSAILLNLKLGDVLRDVSNQPDPHRPGMTHFMICEFERWRPKTATMARPVIQSAAGWSIPTANEFELNACRSVERVGCFSQAFPDAGQVHLDAIRLLDGLDLRVEGRRMSGPKNVKPVRQTLTDMRIKHQNGVPRVEARLNGNLFYSFDELELTFVSNGETITLSGEKVRAYDAARQPRPVAAKPQRRKTVKPQRVACPAPSPAAVKMFEPAQVQGQAQLYWQLSPEQRSGFTSYNETHFSTSSAASTHAYRALVHEQGGPAIVIPRYVPAGHRRALAPC